MKQKILSCFMAVLLCFMCIPASGVSAATVLTQNTIVSENGYDYELWKYDCTASMTLGPNATFDCSWSDGGNAWFSVGKKLDSTRNWNYYNGIFVDYECNYNSSANAWLYVYGLARDNFNQDVEYYIVDSWDAWRLPGIEPKGTISVDGGTYDIYLKTIIVHSIDYDRVRLQYWSVRTSERTSGTVSVSDHFKAWETKGMKLSQVYDVALVVDGYMSSGNAEVIKNDIRFGEVAPKTDVTTVNTGTTISTFATTVTGTSQEEIVSTPPTSGDTLYGDIDCNGSVTGADILRFIEHFLNKPLTGQSLLNADVLYDCKVDMKDLATLKQYLVGDRVTIGVGAPVTNTTMTTDAKPIENSELSNDMTQNSSEPTV